MAASREDVYVLDTRRRTILVMSGLGYPRQILRSALGARVGLRPARTAPRCSAPGTAPGRSTGTARDRSPCSRRGSAWARRHGPGSPRAATAWSTSSTPLPRWPRSSPRTRPRAPGHDHHGRAERAGRHPPARPGRRRGRGPAAARPAPAGSTGPGGLACEAPATTLTRPVLYREGHWISPRLDSGIYRCPWHRIRLQAQLPPATSLRVSTYSQDQPAEDAAGPRHRGRGLAPDGPGPPGRQ